MILEGQDQIRLSLTNIDRKVAELLGRVERLSSIGGGQQQIAQVTFFIYEHLYDNSFFSRMGLVYLLMLLEFKISIE